MPSLAAGATSTGTVTAKVPSMAAGSYYLLACADDTGVVAESNEANNCKASASKVVISAATLTITSPNGGESWKAGEKRDIKWSSNGIGIDDLVHIRLLPQ